MQPEDVRMVRRPAVAGTFYADDASTLRNQLETSFLHQVYPEAVEQGIGILAQVPAPHHLETALISIPEVSEVHASQGQFPGLAVDHLVSYRFQDLSVREGKAEVVVVSGEDAF